MEIALWKTFVKNREFHNPRSSKSLIYLKHFSVSLNFKKYLDTPFQAVDHTFDLPIKPTLRN